MKLPLSFFDRSTVDVARDLLGKVLIFNSSDGEIAAIINEVEAYTQEDPACHAYHGKKTKRNMPMFGPAGTIYIYLIYGMYHCFNIVTETEGRGCAVLIRSVLPLRGHSILTKNRNCSESQLIRSLNGPGKMMLGFNIPMSLNGELLSNSSHGVWIEEACFQPQYIESSPRIGIRKGLDLHWRFRTESVDKVIKN